MEKLFKNTGLSPRIVSILFISLFFFNACSLLYSPPSTVTTVALNRSDVDEIIEQELALQNVLGIAVGVVENGIVTHIRAHGHLDEARTTPVTTSTVFRYASVSKPITALAIFKAISQGHLSLHDKVVDHVPYWPSDGRKDDITIAHLLSHRSGINDYGKIRETGVEVCNTRNRSSNAPDYFEAEKSVERFSDCDLLFIPGTEHAYTTYGYDLLGAVLEEATGMDYVAYVNQHIKNVANLNSLTSSADSPGGYTLTCNLTRSSRSSGPTPIKVPGGGWSSNIRDFTRLLQGFINSEFLSTTAALWQPVNFPTDNKNYVYGLGKKEVDGTDFIRHSGAHSDLKTYFSFFPGDKNGVCVMINGNNANAGRVAEKLFVLMGYSFSPSALPRNAIGDRTECGDRMFGLWRQTGNAEETIVRRGLSNSLFLKEKEALEDLGWMLVDVETYTEGVNRRWDGIFRKGVTATTFLRDLNHKNFFSMYEAENNAGRRLVDIEVYKSGTSTRWAGIFQAGNGGSYALRRDLSSEEFSAAYAEKRAEGRKLIDVETYKKNGSWRWAGVWLGRAESKLNRHYSQTDFIQLCQQRNTEGYRLIDVETYEISGTRYYAGVWEEGRQEEKRWFNGMMGFWVNNKHNVYIEDGFELLDMEMY